MAETLGLISASGALAASIASKLDETARMIMRNPPSSTARHRAVRADFRDPDSLRCAFAGLERLILITPDAPGQAAMGVAAIEAAKCTGVRRIVLISAMLAREDGRDHFAAQHAAIETALAASGRDFAILRPSFFMQSIARFTRGNIVLMPKSRAIAFVDADDVAEAAVLCAGRDSPASGTHVLTGSEALTPAQACAAISRHRARRLRRVTPPRWLFRRLVRQSDGAHTARNLDFLFERLALGEESQTSGDLGAILGRAPTAFDRFAARTYGDRSGAFGLGQP